MPNTRLRLTTIILAASALSACETTTGGNPLSARSSGSGEVRSQVEIVDGDPFTATWQDRSATVIRLTYDSAIPLSDVRAVEIAELMTQCKAADDAPETSVIGGLTSIRIPANCAIQPTAAPNT